MATTSLARGARVFRRNVRKVISLSNQRSNLEITSHCKTLLHQDVWSISKLSANHRQFHSTTSTFAQRNFYDVLGVKKSATAKEIKEAYYKLAKQFHPDRNKGDEKALDKFKEVSQAYEVLSDEQQRRQYDAIGSADFGMGGPPPRGGTTYSGTGFQGFPGDFGGFTDPEELFRKIFGDLGYGHARGRGSFSQQFDQGFGSSPFGFGGASDDGDYTESHYGFSPASEVTMHLSFVEAARGVNKDISLNVVDICPKCSGKRAEPGTKAEKCHYCNGTGMETVSTGPFVMRSTCRYCHGTRTFIPAKCTECRGKGQTVQRKLVTVPVPAGVEDGQSVRIMVGNKEVFVKFKVSKSEQFRREGADIHSDVLISLAQSVLGGTTAVKGIYETLRLKIPPGTSSHERLVLRGKGLRRISGTGYGDHYVHFKVKVPVHLSDVQKAMMQAYAETERDTPGTVDGITDTKQGASSRTSSKDSSEPGPTIQGQTEEEVEEEVEREQEGWWEKMKRGLSKLFT